MHEKCVTKSDFYISEIDKKTANEIVKLYHYIHKRPNNVKSFGLFRKEDNELVGVCIYGVPASQQLCKGICGDEYRKDVLELCRLWVKDDIGKNAESFLVGNTLKLINAKIIISYADASVGHTGYIYQATNFLYTGLSEKHKDLVIKGKGNIHTRHMIGKYKSFEEAKQNEEWYYVQRARKHRYVYFNSSKKENKKLKSLLKYKIEKYPKATSSVVKTS